MKKVFTIIIILIIVLFTFFFYKYNDSYINALLKDIDEEFYIDNYSIFGNHFNISGCIDKEINNTLELVLKNKKEEINLNSIFKVDNNKTCFYISDNINDSINLDNLKIGNYLLLIKDNNKYYTLKNNTEYSNLEYYTITRNNTNNKITIDFDIYNKKNYVEFKIIESKLPSDVYDITIDPGHGGEDSGATSTKDNIKYNESDLVLNIALILKNKLEEEGLKVLITRDSDITLDSYGEDGRAVIPNKYNTKYSISIHLNSTIEKMYYGGVEVYTPNNIDLKLANMLASNISNIVGYSKKSSYKISNGVYYKYFTNTDIEEFKNSLNEKGMIPYDIKENIPYMYMIREVGGILTGAYIDGRNSYYGLNTYYNSNKVAEPYLIELGYINYNKDLELLINNPDLFALAIKNSIVEYLKIS